MFDLVTLQLFETLFLRRRLGDKARLATWASDSPWSTAYGVRLAPKASSRRLLGVQLDEAGAIREAPGGKEGRRAGKD